MRILADTNILISALLYPKSKQENLTIEQKKIIKELVKQLKGEN